MLMVLTRSVRAWRRSSYRTSLSTSRLFFLPLLSPLLLADKRVRGNYHHHQYILNWINDLIELNIQYLIGYILNWINYLHHTSLAYSSFTRTFQVCKIAMTIVLKVGILPLHHLLRFLASIYLDLGFEPLISQRRVSKLYPLGHRVGSRWSWSCFWNDL